MKKVMMIAAVVVMSVGFYAIDTTTDNTKLYNVESALASDDANDNSDNRDDDA